MNSVDPCADPAWERIVQKRGGILFHSPPWLRALRSAYGFNLRASLVGDEGMVLAEVTDALGKRLAVPFSDLCPPLVVNSATWERLFSHHCARGLPLSLRCLSGSLVSQDERFQVTRRARWQSLDLRGEEESLWNGLTPAARRGIRKARPIVEIRPLTDVREFLALHVALRKTKYRMLAPPLAFFETIRTNFQERGLWHALGAYVANRLVAGTIYLRWGETMYYKFNASALDALPTRANNLLVWEGIRRARGLGCRTFDMGPSDDDQPGLIRFKAQFGCQSEELMFLRYAPSEWRECAPARQVLKDLTTALTASSVSHELTAEAGAALYRMFA